MEQRGIVDASCFLEASRSILNTNSKMGCHTVNRCFRAIFGTSPLVCVSVWEHIAPDHPPGGKPRHLLWALLFLKGYNTEHFNATLVRVDEKTFRKWQWTYVDLVAGLELICFEYRKNDAPVLGCFISVDGTDCRIMEPYPFKPIWYSHKFKGPGVRYEIALSVRSATIVWASGPFPCGDFSDLKIFRNCLRQKLDEFEQVIADSGYPDLRCIPPPGTSSPYSKSLGAIRARHEVVNARLKQFSVLSDRFRHSIEKHGYCFYAVLNATFVGLKHEPMFSIDI